MKQLPHLSSLLYATPWAILPATHGELGALYRAYLSGTLPTAPRAIEAEGEARCGGIEWEIDVLSGIAVVSLTGIVVKRDPDLPCGPPVLALGELDRLIRALADDAKIRTVVFHFDSPGGSVTGLEETAANLLDLGAEKRVIAYADNEMCSAAYWLAAACGEIYASPSAVIGSIGTYLAGIDDTRQWEMEGLKLKLFRVGKLKAIGLSGKPWTSDEESYLTDLVLKTGADFRQWVASRRPGVPPSAMEGQWFTAKSAPAGLIDGLYRDLGELVANLLAEAETATSELLED